MFPYTYGIISWISTAVRCNVAVLKLCLRTSQPSSNDMLPRSLFRSRSLKSFHLDMPPGYLSFSCHVCLPSLEELNLSHVVIDDGPIDSLLSTVALKRLYISRCKWRKRNPYIIARKLESLSIDEIMLNDDDRPLEMDIIIFSPSLKFFSYAGSLFPGFDLYDSPQLVKAKIDSVISFKKRLQGRRLMELLNGMESVKALTLSSQCFEVY